LAQSPAALYYFSVFIQADLEAAKRKIAPIPETQIPQLRDVLRGGWFFLIPFAVLIVALFNFHRTAAEAALWAAIAVVLASLAFGYKGARLNARQLLEALRATGLIAIDIVIIGAMAGIVIGILEVRGLGFGLTFSLVQLGGGNLLALLALTAVVSIVLGMGMPTTAIYLLVAVLAAPPLIEMGVEPIAAHLFVLHFGLMSMITPPIALAAFAAANLAGAKPMATSFMALRFGWSAFVVPFVFIASPGLLMLGDATDITIATLKAFAGIWLVSCALMGYLHTDLPWLLRVGLTLAGAGLLLPANVLTEGHTIAIAAGAAGAALVALQLRWRAR
jgi:TRAP transporter 4TM/12TM fusion protein